MGNYFQINIFEICICLIDSYVKKLSKHLYKTLVFSFERGLEAGWLGEKEDLYFNAWLHPMHRPGYDIM